MKQLARFLKDATLGGLLLLLPVVLVFGVFAKLAIEIRGRAQSLIDKVTGETSETIHFPLFIAVFVLLGLSFALGLIKDLRAVQALGDRIERALAHVPGYPAVRALLGGLTEGESEGAVKPALLTLGDGVQCFAYITEDHGNGLLSVFVPDSPNPSSGSVQLVRAELIQPLHVRIADLSLALQQWGVGAARVLAKHQAHHAIPPHR